MWYCYNLIIIFVKIFAVLSTLKKINNNNSNNNNNNNNNDNNNTIIICTQNYLTGISQGFC